jgi:hypothetical protein
MALDQDTARAQCMTPRTKTFPARADVVFYKGAVVCKRIGSKYAEIPDPSAPRTDLIPLGVCMYPLDTTDLADGDRSVCVEAGAYRDFATGSSSNAITANMVGETVYMYDDDTFYATSNGDTLSPGGQVVFVDSSEYDGATQVAIYIDWEQMALQSEVAALSNSLTSDTGAIDLAPSDFYLLTGAPLAVFASGASAVPGSAVVDSKAFGVRWNNNATLDAIVTSFRMPPDADITANMTLTIYASKVGATVGDAVTFVVGAYNQVVGALHDADANFGGTSSAMTGDAATKTIQAVTLTLALANLAASPASVTLSIKPTDGTLGTDDLVFHGARLSYTKKLVP